MEPDGWWRSTVVRALIEDRDLGAVIRMARERRGWRQIDLAAAAGYSRSTVSRLETGAAGTSDLAKIKTIAEVIEMPPGVFACLLGIPATPAVTVVTSVAAVAQEDDRMRRRDLFAAAGLSIPATLLLSLDEALALLPAPTGPADAQQMMARLARARRRWDNGELTTLIGELPDLLATAHQVAEDTTHPMGRALVAGCYDLAAEALNKVGAQEQSRLTADRAVLFASQSENVVAMAGAARTQGIVLRHDGRHELAERVTLQAADRLSAAGLTTEEQVRAYALLLSTTAYNAAQASDRDGAAELIGEARRTATLLPERRPADLPTRWPIHLPQVQLYEVGLWWALGEPGAALKAGRGLRPAMFGTPERRARLHTDLARAEYLAGHPEQAVRRLLAAHQHAPGEMRGRPTIRRLADQVVSEHPRVPGARELSAIIRGS